MLSLAVPVTGDDLFLTDHRATPVYKRMWNVMKAID